jgi:hypothetical protein
MTDFASFSLDDAVRAEEVAEGKRPKKLSRGHKIMSVIFVAAICLATPALILAIIFGPK